MNSKTGKKRAKAEGFDKFDIIKSFRLDGTEIEVTFIERKNYDRVTVILREEDINW